MKKVTYYLITTFFFVGCMNLDEKPIGLLDPESLFKTKADAEAAVFGAYGELAHQDIYGREMNIALQLLSDMADIGDNGTAAYRQEINNFTHTSENGLISLFWPQLYKAISASNAAISGIPNVGLEEDEEKALIHEAKVIRALCYYHLVRLFGDLPFITELITNPSEVSQISRTPANEVYSQIIADCEEAVNWLPDKYGDGSSKTRASKAAAHTLLASIYLTQENWEKAYENAKIVIDKKGDFNVGLVEDFQDLWIAENGDTEETIWAVDFLANTRDGRHNLDYMSPITGVKGAKINKWSVVVPSLKVFESFNDLDYRKEVSFLTEEVFTENNQDVTKNYTEFEIKRPHIAKWQHTGDKTDANGRTSHYNYIIFRYAEVLLIAAEALNELGRGADAVAYVNEIRERARNADGTPRTHPPDITNNGDDTQLRNDILEERRIELAFEWKRWYDLIRRHKYDNYNLSNVFGSEGLETHTNINPAKHKLLPIPNSEILRNPNLLPNNTGY